MGIETDHSKKKVQAAGGATGLSIRRPPEIIAATVNPTLHLSDILHLARSKCRSHGFTSAISILNLFKEHDPSNTGYVDFTGFHFMLRTLNLSNLRPHDAHKLFLHFCHHADPR